MLQKFIIHLEFEQGDTGDDVYYRDSVNETDVRHWIINHLDVSKKWIVSPMLKAQRIMESTADCPYCDCINDGSDNMVCCEACKKEFYIYD